MIDVGPLFLLRGDLDIFDCLPTPSFPQADSPSSPYPFSFLGFVDSAEIPGILPDFSG